MNPITDRTAAAGPEAPSRGLAALGVVGLTIPFSILIIQLLTVGFDTNHYTGPTPSEIPIISGSAQPLATIAACAVIGGLMVSWAISRRRALVESGLVEYLALLSSLCWIAIGVVADPTLVEFLLVAALALCCPFLIIVVPTVTPTADSRGGEVTQSARHEAIAFHWAGVGAGLAIGGLAVLVATSVGWSQLCAAAGVISGIGCVKLLRWKSRHPHRVSVAPGRNELIGPASVLVGLAAICVTPTLSMAHLLRSEWSAGVRYHAMALGLGGVAGAAGAITGVWRSQDRKTPSTFNEATTARLLMAMAVVTLIGIWSFTLIGAVAMLGLAIGAALCIAALEMTRSASWLPVIAGGAITSVLWSQWNPIVEATGSERITMTLCALPALGLGALVAFQTTRPSLPAPAPAPAPRSELTGIPSASTSFLPPTDRDRSDSGGSGVDTTPSLLEVRDLEFSYGNVQVLFGVDIDVAPNQVTALLGANGAGKTTLLRAIAGLHSATSGTVRFGGIDLAPYDSSQRAALGLSSIGAGTAVAPDLSVIENLTMFGHLLDRATLHQRIDEAFDVFPRLAERKSQFASSLSGGERQMLSLAKAVIVHPRLLIIDELSLGLAPVVVAELVPIIGQLVERKVSVLLVEQNVSVALELATNASCMEKGRIAYSGSASELREDPSLLEAVYLEGVAAAFEHHQVGTR